MHGRRRLEAILELPLVLVLGTSIVVPAVVLFGYSLFAWVQFQPTGSLTLANYVEILTDPFSATVAQNTLLIGVPTAVFSIVGGYVLAYYITFGTGRGRQLMFILVVTALMASYLVRVYAWRTLLGASGILNSALIGVGVVDQPVEFIIFSKAAAVIVEVSVFMPLAALIFFAALSGIPPELREAARDLGATRGRALRRITIPLTGPAILSTSTLIFFLAVGDFVTPVFVGGADAVTVGTRIVSFVNSSGNYGMAAAWSFVLLGSFVLTYVGLQRLMKAGGYLPDRVA
jgi:ABC-type spermidine/putrescine transport system permease subunit I